MGLPGFFDVEERYGALDAMGDPLVVLKNSVPWEESRPLCAKVHEKERKSPAGRKPLDPVMMFKALVVQSLYNLSDQQMEYQIKDRMSFMRFLGLNLEDTVPDATTLWSYRQALTEQGLLEGLFERFNAYLNERGYQAKAGQIIDASIVPVPRQRNTREENAAIKGGELPEGWEDNPAMRRQKDTDARWTKKHGKSYFGYKNHINVDTRHKLIRKFTVTDAATHDSQLLAEVLDEANAGISVWADSAYRSEETEQWLGEVGFKSQIHYKGQRSKPLSAYKKRLNRLRSTIRARVEHVFGFQHNSMGGKLIRTIGTGQSQDQDRADEPHLQHNALSATRATHAARLSNRKAAMGNGII